MIEAERAALRRRYEQERDKRLRPDGNDQYLELKGQFAACSMTRTPRGPSAIPSATT